MINLKIQEIFPSVDAISKLQNVLALKVADKYNLSSGQVDFFFLFVPLEP